MIGAMIRPGRITGVAAKPASEGRTANARDVLLLTHSTPLLGTWATRSSREREHRSRQGRGCVRQSGRLARRQCLDGRNEYTAPLLPKARGAQNSTHKPKNSFAIPRLLARGVYIGGSFISGGG